MRRRSSTIHAESMEEYTVLAVEAFECSNLYDKFNTLKSSAQAKNFSWSHSPPPSLNKGREKPLKKLDIWSTFDYKKADVSDISTSASDASDRQKNLDLEMEYTEAVATESSVQSQRLVVKRFMVMGTTSSDGYGLVNSGFQTENDLELMPINQTMDLIIKTIENQGLKCFFWIKTLEDSRFNNLMNVYYKSTSIFIFVYSTSDRNSLNLAEVAIQQVLAEVPKEKFIGILLGNKIQSEENRRVSYDEGLYLKEKYDLSFFRETSRGDSGLKDKILSLYDTIF